MLKKFKFSFFIPTEKFWNYINNKQTWTPKAKPSMDEWKVKAHISKNDLKISCLFILSSLLLVYARIVEFFRCLQALSFIFISPAFTYSFTESEIDLEFEKKHWWMSYIIVSAEKRNSFPWQKWIAIKFGIADVLSLVPFYSLSRFLA